MNGTVYRPEAPAHEHTKDTRRSGLVSVVCGVVAVLALVWTWVLSVSDVLDPPDWVRIPGILLMPAALVVGLAAALQARQGNGRRHGTVGLGLVALVVLGFIVLLNVAG
jgi:hypothetical protein